MGALFAATYPEMVERLILLGAMARFSRAPDYPHSPTLEQIAAVDRRHLGQAGIGAPVRARAARTTRPLRGV